MKILATTIVMLANASAFSQTTFVIKNASKAFKVQVKVAKCDDLSCSGNVSFAIYNKRAVKPFQTIHLKETQMSLDDNVKPEIATVKDRKNGKWSSVYFEDSDFDGLEDLAVADGNNGGYGGTSYRIYLFDQTRKRFMFSRLFTRLGQGPYMGIPEINIKNKTLEVFWESGVGFHQTERYSVSRKRLQKTYEYSESTMIGDGNRYITTKKLINGKWRVWNKTVKDNS